MAAIASEYVLFESADNFFKARDLLKQLVGRKAKMKNWTCPKWTLTHTQFAYADGFYYSSPQKREKSFCSPDDLRELIEAGHVASPPISKEELESRGKSDWVVKLIAMLQIVRLVVQTLFRATQHYQTTALEIMTAAFVFCSVFIFCFRFNQPQNVEYPVTLELEDVALIDMSNQTYRAPSSTPSPHAEETIESDPSIHAVLNSPPSTSAGEPIDSALSVRKVNSAPLHQAKKLNESDPSIHAVSYFPPSTSAGEPIDFALSVRKVNSAPLHHAGKTELAQMDGRAETVPSTPTPSTKRVLPIPNKFDQYVPGWTAQIVPALLFLLFASGFGAIHCLAWHSPFPTVKERLAWRICSVTTTSLPALAA
ncbi:hypothetical protein MMC28_011776 [Mycoblastus sanguinarius]|nr:hypothetical protein [Mycoblastus sanguinarius]